MAGQVNFGKLLRIDGVISSLREELTLGEVSGAGARHRLSEVATQVLVEAGSALPESALQELGRLVGSLDKELTPDEVRIVLAQLQGWGEGLLAGTELAVGALDSVPSGADGGHEEVGR